MWIVRALSCLVLFLCMEFFEDDGVEQFVYSTTNWNVLYLPGIDACRDVT